MLEFPPVAKAAAKKVAKSAGAAVGAVGGGVGGGVSAVAAKAAAMGNSLDPRGEAGTGGVWLSLAANWIFSVLVFFPWAVELVATAWDWPQMRVCSNWTPSNPRSKPGANALEKRA